MIPWTFAENWVIYTVGVSDLKLGEYHCPCRFVVRVQWNSVFQTLRKVFKIKCVSLVPLPWKYLNGNLYVSSVSLVHWKPIFKVCHWLDFRTGMYMKTNSWYMNNRFRGGVVLKLNILFTNITYLPLSLWFPLVHTCNWKSTSKCFFWRLFTLNSVDSCSHALMILNNMKQHRIILGGSACC